MPPGPQDSLSKARWGQLRLDISTQSSVSAGLLGGTTPQGWCFCSQTVLCLCVRSFP